MSYSFCFSCHFQSGPCQLSLMGAPLPISCRDQYSWIFIGLHVYVLSGFFGWGVVILVRYVMCVAHNVCIMLGSSSMFLVSLLLCDNGRKVIIIVLSQQGRNYDVIFWKHRRGWDRSSPIYLLGLVILSWICSYTLQSTCNMTIFKPSKATNTKHLVMLCHLCCFCAWVVRATLYMMESCRLDGICHWYHVMV